MDKRKGKWISLLVLGLGAWTLAGRPGAAQTFTDVTSAVTGNPLWGPAAAWGDYDNDGDLDLYLAHWLLGGGVPNNVLLQNNGDGTFTDVTATTGSGNDNVGDASFSSVAVWGDYDNDGDLDLLVGNIFGGTAVVLYENRLDEGLAGRFRNVSQKAGLLVRGETPVTGAAWGDYDGDGFLDLYVAAFGRRNILYHNLGNKTFDGTDQNSVLADQVKVTDVRDAQHVCWVDYDDDGDLDLYVVNLDQENVFYQNNGDGTFTETAYQLGLADLGLGRRCAWSDYDNDGDLDLFLSNVGQNLLLRNDGTTFGRVAGAMDRPGQSLAPQIWVHWAGTWADYDLDGDPDLFLALGAESAGGEHNFLFANNAGTFSDATTPAGLGTAADSSTVGAWGDYDNDGDPDLYLMNYGANILYRNDTRTAASTDSSFLKVIPKRKGAADGIGARIRVFQGNSATGTPLAVYHIQSGYNALEAIFGGLNSTLAYTVEVTFSTGNPVTFSTDSVLPETVNRVALRTFTVQEP